MSFQQKLEHIIHKNNSLVCVGLDSDYNKLPEHVRSRPNSLFEFNKAIIEATHDLVCAYKPNTAFYEALGADGVYQLKMTLDYLQDKHPEIVTILDAKRADIGNTNQGYLQFAFDFLGADSITLHPYLGREALQPFLDRADKGLIILGRTSNPGAGEFQDLSVEGRPLYQIVAERVSREWNRLGNCLLVVGTTYPDELAALRKLAPKLTFLVPGIGAQGGEVEATVKAGQNNQGTGMIVNSSRGIIFAGNQEDFAEVARQKTQELRDQINEHRSPGLGPNPFTAAASNL